MSFSKLTIASLLFAISLNGWAYHTPPSALTSSLMLQAVSVLSGIEQSVAAFRLAEKVPDNTEHYDTLWVGHLGYVNSVLEIVPVYLSLVLMGIYLADSEPHLRESAIIPRNLAFTARLVCTLGALLNASSLIFAFNTLSLMKLSESTKLLFWSMTSASVLSLAANLGAWFALGRLGVVRLVE